MSQWATELGISRQCLHQRLKLMPADEALSYRGRGKSPSWERYLQRLRAASAARDEALRAAVAAFEEAASRKFAKAVTRRDERFRHARLTHEQRRARRTRMAALVAAGHGVNCVANYFGVHKATVRLAVKESMRKKNASERI